jgi:prepilin-type N-terminal cleavage/methylation domain-containing protein
MKLKGFTLIELLVVISIIGVIASIAFVSLSGQRDKAKIARSQQFSANINHSLGAYAVGIWDFEDQNNPTADRSGYGNDGTLYGDTHFVANDVLGGYALGFDGSGDYVNCGDSSSLKIDDKSFTLEAWIKPASHINVGSRFTVMAFYNPGWIMDLPNDGGVEGYRFYSGSAVYKYTPTNNLISLDWTHFVITRILDENILRIYLNGELKQSWGIASVTVSTNPLLIGMRTGGCYFNGTIDNVRIYSEALSVGQIQQHYAAGAAKHGLTLK